MTLPHIVITPGEPAGVGPDVLLQIINQPWDAAITVIADPDMLTARAKQLGLQITITEDAPQPHTKGTIHILPVHTAVNTQAGIPDTKNADYVLQTLDTAATLCMQGKANALVTGPVQKSMINAAGKPFSGHTEYLANHAGVEQTVMLFVVDQLKVALATTHIPLAKVSATITEPHLREILTILDHDLRRYFNIAKPHILVAGLNPHAGENGYLGREEIDTISPLLKKLNGAGMQLEGPLPADTLFLPEKLQQADAVLAMYHDQALPVVKHLGFDRAVNMTLGLPYIRTSVDHGTALDIAGSGTANPGSLAAALSLAISSATPPSSSD